MITPRATRLVRTADLRAFRDAVIALACGGAPTDARDRLVVVPTRAAGAHLVTGIEDRVLAGRPAVMLPDLATRDELAGRLAERLDEPPSMCTDAEREVLMSVACRAARDAGAGPPFGLRPRLVAEILAFYDELRRHQGDVSTFERLVLGRLEPGAAEDRGAERLVRQTRFLAAAFRAFEATSSAIGLDEHRLRERLLAGPARRPYQHIVQAVGDRASTPYGLYPADWDLLARLPGLARLDVVMTDGALAGRPHERIHHMLPGIEEVRFESARPGPRTVLVVPPASPVQSRPSSPSGDTTVRTHVVRDREEEVAVFARHVRDLVRRGDLTALDRAALVVHQPLPYVYIAREVLRSAGVPSQLFDALPLAAEPPAAALDLVLSCVTADFARGPAIALLRSPHFTFAARDGPLTRREVAALDRALAAQPYHGDIDRLDGLVASWRLAHGDPDLAMAGRAGAVLVEVLRSLVPLRSPAGVADHLRCLRSFLDRHEPATGAAPDSRNEPHNGPIPGPDDPVRARQLRAGAAIRRTLDALIAAHARFDPEPVPIDHLASLVRRWIEGQTFRPRSGESGVHVVDAVSAPFGDFEVVQLAGLVDGEWPAPPRRNVFYGSSVLRDLGWPAGADRLDGARAAFRDLLRLPAARLVATSFALEGDALVGPSPFVDELGRAGLDTIESALPPRRVFEHEALGFDPVVDGSLSGTARAWAALRLRLPPASAARYRGSTSGHVPPAHAISALERYQDCPFKYFAADVLRLEEPLEDERTLSPRARGRFVHDVFRRCFEAWDRQGGGSITPDRLDDARGLFARVAEPLLATLPEPDRAFERSRLFGSAVSVGAVDVVLGLEAERPDEVRGRRLELRVEGEFSLGAPGGRRVSITGVADRIDLLEGGRIRVLDYKTGLPPNPQRALQVPVYALCAKEGLSRDATPWEVAEAAYVAFSGRRPLVPVVEAGDAGGEAVLARARARLFDAVDRIAAGEFPPRPHDPGMCIYCAFPSVCRKDYVGDR